MAHKKWGPSCLGFAHSSRCQHGTGVGGGGSPSLPSGVNGTEMPRSVGVRRQSGLCRRSALARTGLF